MQKPFKIIVERTNGEVRVTFDMHPVGESCAVHAQNFKQVMQQLGDIEKDDWKNDGNTNVHVAEG